MNSIRPAALALAAAGLLPLLPACSPAGESADPPQVAQSAARLTVTNARVVLPPVAGNPAAVYLDLAYAGAPGVSLTEVELAGAGMTMIHDYAEEAGKMRMVMTDAVPLAEGTPVSFAPGGLHVMALDPTAVLTPGGTAKLTLTLSDGTVTSLDVPVRAAGDER